MNIKHNLLELSVPVFGAARYLPRGMRKVLEGARRVEA